MDAFWSSWLCGLSKGLHALSTPARDTLLTACGRACAAPEVLPRMRALLLKASDTDAFFHSVGQRMAGVHVSSVLPGRVYDFLYQECGCPLYTEQGLREQWLCECSRHSLAWVMSELFPENPPQVTLLESILRGDPGCRLRVTFAAPQSTAADEAALLAANVGDPQATPENS